MCSCSSASDSLNTLSGSDHVTQFQVGVDKIDISAIAVDGGVDFHMPLIADGAGAVTVLNQNGATFVSVFTNGDAAPDMVFIIDQMVGGATLTEADFIF